MRRIATSSSARNATAAAECERETPPDNFPRDALHGARLQFAGTPIDLREPGCLDARFGLLIEAVEERANEVDTIRLRKSQRRSINVVFRSCHAQTLHPSRPAGEIAPRDDTERRGCA